MYILNFPFFLNINNIKYFTNNYKGLIVLNRRFSPINFLSAYYSVSINLYIKKDFRLIVGNKGKLPSRAAAALAW